MIYTLQFILMFVMSVGSLKHLSKYTTIGDKEWFGDLIFNLTCRLKSSKLSNFITNMSYGKLLVCRPCQTTWMTFLMSALIGSQVTDSITGFILNTIFVTIPVSFIGYFNALGYFNKLGHDKK